MRATTTIRGIPMSLFIFLTVTQAIVAALLVLVILMQKSEGGGLGTGGSPAGLMSARGAADFMTRLTAILATSFVVLSIVLAALATRSSGNRTIDDSLQRTVPVQQAPAAPVDPLGGAGAVPPAGAAGTGPAGGSVPNAPATK
jgi:preprotein translocase subunit SecG